MPTENASYWKMDERDFRVFPHSLQTLPQKTNNHRQEWRKNTPTSPSEDCSKRSFLQYAVKSPTPAFSSTPLGASRVRVRVGDSSLSNHTDTHRHILGWGKSKWQPYWNSVMPSHLRVGTVRLYTEAEPKIQRVKPPPSHSLEQKARVWSDKKRWFRFVSVIKPKKKKKHTEVQFVSDAEKNTGS